MCIIFGVTAQTKISHQVIASSGDQMQSASMHLDFTMGEFMIESLGSDPKVTHGFQQPQLSMMVRVVDPLFAGKIKVYPNPVHDVLNVAIEEEGAFHLVIIDMYGKEILSNEFSTLKQMNIKHLTPGSYALVIAKNGLTVYSGIFEK